MPGAWASRSWEQPPGEGLGGWEGYCGQTAVSNLLANSLPSLIISPPRVIRVASDWSPGSRAETLLRALNSLSGSRRTYRITRNHPPALESATPRHPIATLMQWESKTLHWVTVVGKTQTRVYFNHWGTQQSLTTREFDNRWGFRDQGWVDWGVSIAGGISRYTAIG